MLQKLVGERRPAYLAIAMDSKGRTFRHELDPNYKATRSARPPDLALQMERSREIVEAYRIPIFQRDGVEADDLIATAVKHAVGQGLFVVIVGADKDLMQLLGERVVMWDTMRDKTYGPPEVLEKFGVPPAQMRDLLALVGDTSDNIPGVPSVGPKTAAELLHTFETLDGIYAHLADIQKKRLREVLVENEANARLSQKLVSLRDDEPIAWSLGDLRYGGADFERLRDIYTELGFNRMIASIPMDAVAGPPASKEAARCRAIDSVEALRELARRAREAPLLAVGIETTSPEAMRAVLIGLALATEVGEGCYVPIGHRYIGSPKQVTLDQVREVLGPVLGDPKVPKVGHDLKYIEVALGRHGMPLEGAAFDVMIASYLLDPEAPHTIPMLAREPTIRFRRTTRSLRKRAAPQLSDSTRSTSSSRPALLGQERGGRSPACRAHEAADRTPGSARRHGRSRSRSRACSPRWSASACSSISTSSGALQRTSTPRSEAREARQGKRRARFQRQLATPARGHSVRRPGSGHQADQDGAIDGRRRAEQLAEHHPLPGILLEHRQLSKLKGDVHRRVARPRQRETGRIHGWGRGCPPRRAHLVEQSELAEYPRSYRSRARHPPCVRRAARHAHRDRGLFADRAPRACPLVEGPRAGRRVSNGAGRPRAHRDGGFQRCFFGGHRRDAPHGQDHQLRRHLWDGRSRTRQAARYSEVRGGGFHRGLFQTLRQGPFVHG
jgi:DNA polymerase-1